MGTLLDASTYVRGLLRDITWTQTYRPDQARIAFQLKRHFQLLNLKEPDIEFRDDPDHVNEVYAGQDMDTWVLWQDVDAYVTRLHSAGGDMSSVSTLMPGAALQIIARQYMYQSSDMGSIVGGTGFLSLVGSSVLAWGGWLPAGGVNVVASTTQVSQHVPTSDRTMWGAFRHRHANMLDMLHLHEFIEPDHLTHMVDAGVALVEAFYHGAGLIYVRGRRLVVTPRPVVRTDERGRLHCGDGPAVTWALIRDRGLVSFDVNEITAAPSPLRYAKTMWYIDGVEVPMGWVLNSSSMMLNDVEGEVNVERRRIAMKLFGYDRYMRAGKAKKLHTDDFGTLWFRTDRRDEDLYLVEVVNSTPEPDGTFKNYWLRVDPDAYDGDAGRIAQAAVASTWRDAQGELVFEDWKEYAPAVES